MNLSYWERETWFQNIDYVIIGSGIVGLNCALQLRNAHPNSKILVFEKGMLPSGASTKNAGFACFGSASEILSDLETHSEEEVVALVKERLTGLQLLRDTLGDSVIDYQENGSYEVFLEQDIVLFEKSVAKIDSINRLLHPIFEADIFEIVDDPFGFEGIHQKLIYNRFEGQIDTGKMMQALLKKAASNNIQIINNTQVIAIEDTGATVFLTIENNNETYEIKAQNVCIATNGFAQQFLNENVQPARAQVLITKPIKNLAIKGTFHLDQGYYYYRNIGDRILFGGGRNLDFKTENTREMGLTAIVQQKLEALLNTVILPNTPFEVEARWSGIMGVGNQKKPIVKKVSKNIFCGVRLGGMGVAIGSSIGKQLALLAQ
jgi:gamma-glutamylputrescine oxidase